MALKKHKNKIYTCSEKNIPKKLDKGFRLFVTDTEVFLNDEFNEISLPQRRDGNGKLVNILPTELLEIL